MMENDSIRLEIWKAVSQPAVRSEMMFDFPQASGSHLYGSAIHNIDRRANPPYHGERRDEPHNYDIFRQRNFC